MKKLFVLLLLISYIAVFISGCSSAEYNYYNIQKEMADLNKYESTGQLTLTINLPELNDQDTISDVLAREILGKGLVLKYTAKADIENKKSTILLYYKDPLTNNIKELTEIFFIGQVFYFKTSGLLNLLKDSGNVNEFERLSRALNGAEYISFTLQEYMEVIGGQAVSPLQVSFLEKSISNQKKTNNLYFKFLDGLFTDVLSDFSTGMVTQAGNKYTLKLEFTQMVNVFIDMANYIINHIDSLEIYLITFLNNLSAEEISIIGLNQSNLNAALLQIKMLSADIKLNKDKYQTMFDKASQDPELQKLKDVLSLSSTIEKINSGIYESSLIMSMNSSLPAEPFKISISLTDKTQVSSDFSITVPTEKIMKLHDFIDILSETMEVSVDSGAYQLTGEGVNQSGTVKVKLIDNATYLPLRYISETFNEEVGWDQTLKMAFVKRGSRIIYFTGKNLNGVTYIKIRDFTKLGYKVDWNSTTRTAIITKVNF